MKQTKNKLNKQKPSKNPIKQTIKSKLKKLRPNQKQIKQHKKKTNET